MSSEPVSSSLPDYTAISKLIQEEKWNVDVKLDEKKGRCLVAAAPFKKGDTILSETASFSTVVSGSNVCSHCLSGRQTVQCKHCSLPYCSSTCRTAAWKYHQYICVAHRVLQRTDSLPESSMFKSSFHLLSTATQQASYIFQVYAEYCADSPLYRTFMSLQAEAPVPSCTMSPVLACCAIDVLKVVSSDQVRKEDLEDANIHIGKEVHSEEFLNTVLSWTERFDLNKFQVHGVDEHNHPYARAVFPALSMVNHSCGPSAVYSFEGSRVSLVATRDIGHGDQISITYIPLEDMMIKAETSEQLLSSYGFSCLCKVCHPSKKKKKKKKGKNGEAVPTGLVRRDDLFEGFLCKATDGCPGPSVLTANNSTSNNASSSGKSTLVCRVCKQPQPSTFTTRALQASALAQSYYLQASGIRERDPSNLPVQTRIQETKMLRQHLHHCNRYLVGYLMTTCITPLEAGKGFGGFAAQFLDVIQARADALYRGDNEHPSLYRYYEQIVQVGGQMNVANNPLLSRCVFLSKKLRQQLFGKWKE